MSSSDNSGIALKNVFEKINRRPGKCAFAAGWPGIRAGGTRDDDVSSSNLSRCPTGAGLSPVMSSEQHDCGPQGSGDRSGIAQQIDRRA
jgi:hypothetical protein